MNTLNDQVNTTHSNAGVDYCSKNFLGADSIVVNSYKCNARKLTASDVWALRNNQKGFTIGSAEVKVYYK